MGQHIWQAGQRRRLATGRRAQQRHRGRQYDPWRYVAAEGCVRVFSEGIPATAAPNRAKDSRAGERGRCAQPATGASHGRCRTNLFLRRVNSGHFLYPGRTGTLRGGDHTSFNKEGFTAVRITVVAGGPQPFSTRMCVSRTACSSAICCSLSTLAMWRRWQS